MGRAHPPGPGALGQHGGPVRVLVRHHLVPHLGTRRLRSLSVEHLEAALAKARHTRTGEPLGRSTLVRLRSILGQALTEAERRGYVSRNVAGLAVLPAGKEPARWESLTAAQARHLLASARGDRLEAVWVVALCLGMRPGELAGITWRDVTWTPHRRSSTFGSP